MKLAKIVTIGLPVLLLPCIASAVVMPTGKILEQVDLTFLGDGVILPPSEEASPVKGWAVQVGAFADQGTANAQLTRIAAMLPSTLADTAHEVLAVTGQDGKILYRARLGGFDQTAAQSACAALGQQGEACFVSKEDADLRAATPQLRGSTTTPAIASGATSPLTHLASAQAVGDAELQEMRGGFFTAAGAHFDFGANIQTMVNGQLVLQSSLTWTPAGAVMQQLAGLGSSIHEQVNSDLAKAGIATGTLSATPPTGTAGTPSVSAVQTPTTAASPTAPQVPTVTIPINAPSAAAASGAPKVPGLSGVQIQSPGGGSTEVLSNLGGNSLQNIVLNSASNQNIVQNTNVMLTIYNFPDWQQQIAQNAVAANLAHDVMSAAGLGGNR
ncbi:MAG TPA: SPOR domain-containing protein [Rhizomicrobium sp.]|jgi:hypothetical protein